MQDTGNLIPTKPFRPSQPGRKRWQCWQRAYNPTQFLRHVTRPISRISSMTAGVVVPCRPSRCLHRPCLHCTGHCPRCISRWGHQQRFCSEWNKAAAELRCIAHTHECQCSAAAITHLMTPTNSEQASDPSFSTSNSEKMMSTWASSSGLPVIFLAARCSAHTMHIEDVQPVGCDTLGHLRCLMKREHRSADQNGQCRRLESCLEVRLAEETHRVVVQVRRDRQAVYIAPQRGKRLKAVLGHLGCFETVGHAVHLPRGFQLDMLKPL